MRFGNETDFEESLRAFVAYTQTADYRRDERDYKEDLIRTLGAALSDEALGSPDFPAILREALRRRASAIDNLSHWTAVDSFKKYLAVAPADRVREILRGLFDERLPLAHRVDLYLRELRGDYEKFGLPVKTSWLASVFLSARFPDECIFYRPTVVQAVCRKWGVEPPRGNTNGETFAAYLEFLAPIRERLSAALGRPADLIDAQSFLWYTHDRREGARAPAWPQKLREWLRTHPKVMPDELRQLREEFMRRFPKEKLVTLTLEEYALGHEGYRDSFCYWLEFKTKKLGHMGGTAAKFGVWMGKNGEWRWNNIYRSAVEALERIREGLLVLIEMTEERNFNDLDRIGGEHLGRARHGLRCKPLTLYFPDEFLPVWQPEHIAYFLSVFGAEPQGEVLARNRQLLSLLRSLPEFEGFDTLQMVLFLYDSFPPPIGGDEGDPKPPAPEPAAAPAEVPYELRRLMDTVARTRNVLLYGPPGTGKTYLVGRFARHFLRPQLAPAANSKQHRLKALEGLKWYEAIALAMSLSERKTWRVPELEADDLLRDYVTLKNSVKPQNTIHAQLQRHTSPHNPHVKISGYQEPVLFQKNEHSEWSLAPEGAEYVEATLGDVRARLLNPQGGELKVEDFCEFVTFHQSFAYEEFVEGIKPITSEETGGISYEVVPGVFRRICARAEAAWNANRENSPKYLLVIDEINRANIAKVLGELITLVEDDKRLGMPNEVAVTLPVSGERFGVPPNLYILGTMNTADRSIALLDLALRRRFTFVEMMPDAAALGGARVGGVGLGALLERLNERVSVLLDRDHQIGHSYLLNLKDETDLRFAWYARVVPLLQEYFYNDYERLKMVIGGDFVRPAEVSPATKKALGDLDIERPPHVIAELDGEEFLSALRRLAGDARGGNEEDSAAEESA